MVKVFAASILLICMIVAVPPAMAAANPYGVWLMGAKVAVQVFDCSGNLCAHVVWLKKWLDPQGLLKRDTLNPDPALRQRQVCGPTVIWNMRPTEVNHWAGGWFYNADDGTTYMARMEIKSDDLIVARAYLGLPIFGVDETLVRVPMGTSAGWC